MRNVGEICLLATLVASGVAGFVSFAPPLSAAAKLRSAVTWAVWGCFALLTLVVGILAAALYRCDFSYDYVARNSSELLPWYYSVSSLWVGQAGSLLLWAWFLAAIAAGFRVVQRRRERDVVGERIRLLQRNEDVVGERIRLLQRNEANSNRFADSACGVLLGYLCFLVAVMVFAADPMAANPRISSAGAGMSPLLQHPAMLIHPPVVFLGYALWTVPFALCVGALASGRVDGPWLRQARGWSVAAWAVLGVGILLGANWAYEELGWGGYWGWDPVENGSLIPWIAGTAAVHALMVWQHRGVLKKTAVALVMATFALCNFATFLTRSGIFSSLHAFSSSPIGWLFLALMAVLLAGGGWMLWRRRGLLAAERSWDALASRESVILLSIVTLMLLLVAVLGGTLSSAISSAVAERMILVGPGFYNAVLIPVGLVLLASTAAAPLLRWGKPPTGRQTKAMLVGAFAGLVTAVAVAVLAEAPLLLAVVAGMGAFAAFAFAASLVFDAARHPRKGIVGRAAGALAAGRPMYAGFLIHLGFAALALGVTASSLSTTQQDVSLSPGETIDWNDRQVQFVAQHERKLPDKMVIEAELVVASGSRTATLFPGRHFHRLSGVWTTEVAIDASLSSDVYAILHGADSQGRVRLTLIENPLVAWIWLGGGVMAVGAVVRLWPRRRRRSRASAGQAPQDTAGLPLPPTSRAA